MIVVVDSDGLIGSINPNDVHYSASQKVISKLAEKNSQLIYPATTITESITFLQGRLNRQDLAESILKNINSNRFTIASVDKETIKQASLLMNLKRSKHHTLFDCIVAVITKEYNADAIFSFDKFYKSKGFILASELL